MTDTEWRRRQRSIYAAILGNAVLMAGFNLAVGSAIPADCVRPIRSKQRPLALARPPEDRRDPMEMARAANAALHGSAA